LHLAACCILEREADGKKFTIKGQNNTHMSWGFIPVSKRPF
jgi:hypothetical protein